MPQSYKTNQRFTFLRSSRFFLLVLLAGISTFTLASQKPASKDSRGAEFFPHYEYRFNVPVNQTDALWKYILALVPKENQNDALEDENLTDLYFDTPNQALRDQNMALRQRLSISGEGRKENLQLLMPMQTGSLFGYEVRFKHNKHPDKGSSFTNHPVLKLLRSKDRPVLDSLLRSYQIKTAALETALEINQDRRRLHLRNHGNDWITVTLTALRIQAPDHTIYQLQIQADPGTMQQLSPKARQQLIKATDALVHKFRKQFPELKPETRQEYKVMEALHHQPAVQKVNTKVVFAVFFLVLILTVILVRHFRRKPVKPFE